MTHTIIRHGDCLEILPNVKEGSISAIITDLPYKITQNKWDIPIAFECLWPLVHRVLKPNGVFITSASQPFTSALVMSNLKDYRHEWIWLKNRGSNFANTVREPFKEHESVVVFSKGGWTYNKQMQERTGAGLDRVEYGFSGDRNSDNYGKFKVKPVENYPELRVPSSWQKFNTEVGLHPTQKPVALYEYLIKTYTDENEWVLDICMGSGTTGVAAKNLNRNFVGIEKEEKYFNVAKERIENAKPNS